MPRRRGYIPIIDSSVLRPQRCPICRGRVGLCKCIEKLRQLAEEQKEERLRQSYEAYVYHVDHPQKRKRK